MKRFSYPIFAIFLVLLSTSLYAATACKLCISGRGSMTGGVTVPSKPDASLPASGDEGNLSHRSNDAANKPRGLMYDTGYGQISVTSNRVNVYEYCPSAVAHTAATCLSTAVSTLGSTNSYTLVIPDPQTIPANLTITSNITLEFSGPGQLQPAVGTNITLNSAPVAPPDKQIFGGSGTVSFAITTTVSPMWFGAKGDGSTDDASAINKAILSLTVGGVIDFPVRTYKVNSSLQVAFDINTWNNWYILRGNGSLLSAATGITAGVISVGYTFPDYQNTRDIQIENFRIETSAIRPTDGSIGIKINAIQRGKITGCSIMGFDKGISATDWDIASGIIANRIKNNNIGIYGVYGINGLLIAENSIESNVNGIETYGGHSVKIIGNKIINNTAKGVRTGLHATLSSTGTIVSNNYFEGNPTYDVEIGGTQAVLGGTFTGNSHQLINGSTAYRILNIDGGITLYSNAMYHSGAGTHTEYDWVTTTGLDRGFNWSSYNFAKNGNFYAWGGTNIVNNWTVSNSIPVKETTIVKDAAQSLKLTANGANALLDSALTADEVRLIRGKVVTISAWAYAPATNDKPQVLSIAGTSETTSITIPKDATWHYITFNATLLATDTAISLRIYANKSAVSDTNNIVYVSNLSLRLGNSIIIPFTPNAVDSLRLIRATATWDPPNLADGGLATTTITVPGAAVGDLAWGTLDTIGANTVFFSAYVSAPNTVYISLMNKNGAPLDIASGNLNVEVRKW